MIHLMLTARAPSDLGDIWPLLSAHQSTVDLDGDTLTIEVDLSPVEPSPTPAVVAPPAVTSKCLVTTYLDAVGTIACEQPRGHKGAHASETFHATWPAGATRTSPRTSKPADGVSFTDRILAELEDEPEVHFRAKELSDRIDVPASTVSALLSQLADKGRITKVDRGIYTAARS